MTIQAIYMKGLELCEFILNRGELNEVSHVKICGTSSVLLCVRWSGYTRTAQAAVCSGKYYLKEVSCL